MTHFILRVPAAGTGNYAVAAQSHVAELLLSTNTMYDCPLSLVCSCIAPVCLNTALVFTDFRQSLQPPRPGTLSAPGCPPRMPCSVTYVCHPTDVFCWGREK